MPYVIALVIHLLSIIVWIGGQVFHWFVIALSFLAVTAGIYAGHY